MNKYLNTINPGDRVSWRFDNQQRQFGTVIRETGISDGIWTHLAYRVRGDDKSNHLIPARLITKECE